MPEAIITTEFEMPVSKRELEEALVDGATEGLTSMQLFAKVRGQYPKAKTGKIVRAAFHVLSEPTLKDRNILDVIYALALAHRLDEAPEDGSDGDDVDEVPVAPKPKPAKSKAATLPLPETEKKRRKKGA